MILNQNKVAVAMARKGMDKTQLAKAAGVSRNRMYVILNSRTITPMVAGKLATALDVDVTELLETEN